MTLADLIRKERQPPKIELACDLRRLETYVVPRTSLMLRYFSAMEDSRINQGRRHDLLDMIVIALCVVITQDI